MSSCSAQTLFLIFELLPLKLPEEIPSTQIASLEMSSASASASSALEIEEVLNLYRVCFESAVKFYRPKSIINFKLIKKNSQPKAIIWSVVQGASAVKLDQLPSHMTKEQKKAYRKWNLCDTFCLLLHEPLRRHLKRKQPKL